MKPIIIRLTVALITFIVGIALFSITESRRSRVSPVTLTVKPVRQHEESPPLPADGEIPKRTDLSIVVELGGSPPSFDVRHIKLSKNGQTTVALDLGEYIDGQEVTLHFQESGSSYRLLQRYRTSMTISAEGPHLDLVDWRHFDSPWIPWRVLSF